jgi:hypothetical protein
MEKLKIMYTNLQSIAIEHKSEQQEVSDALAVARSIDNRYQTDDILRLKAQILIEPLQKYWPLEISEFLKINKEFCNFPEEYKKRAEIARAEYRIDHLKHYIVTGHKIDWEQLKSDSKLIKDIYDKK